MLVEYTRIAAVISNRDILRIVLENHARLCRRIAAGQLRDASACVPRRQHSAPIRIMPCCAVLQPQVERTAAKSKSFQIGVGSRECRIDAASCIVRNNVAAQLDRAVAFNVIFDVDIDPAAVPRVEGRRILGSVIRRRRQAVKRHCAIERLHRLTDLRTADVNLCHAGNIRRAARCADAPCGPQRGSRDRVIGDETQRPGLDVERFAVVLDGCRLLDVCHPSAGLYGQGAARRVDFDVCTRCDRAPSHRCPIPVSDRRILREAIRAVRLLDMCIDIFLIRRAEETLRELRRRLLIARRRRRRRSCRVAALLTRESDVLVDGGKRQSLADGKLAREFAVCIALVRQLVRQCIENRVLIRCRHAARIREEREDVLRTYRLIDDDVAGFKRRRGSCIVIVDSDRMSAVISYRDGLRIFLIDDAALFCTRAAEELTNIASANVALAFSRTDDFTCADVLYVLIVAFIARFVKPFRTVLQVKIRGSCIDETVQP